MAASTPGIAPAYSAKAEPGSPPEPVRFQGLEKVDRARRFKPAAAAGSLEKREDRREQDLVTANKKTRQKDHQGARIEARSARCNHSSRSWS